MNEKDPGLFELAARAKSLWSQQEKSHKKHSYSPKKISANQKSTNQNEDIMIKELTAEKSFEEQTPSIIFEELLSDLVNQILSQESVRAEIKRRSWGFMQLVRMLCRYYIKPEEPMSEKLMNDFETFFKFYLLRSDYAHVGKLLCDVHEGFRKEILDNKKGTDVFMRLLKMMSLLTSYNTFGDERGCFLTGEGFLGFEVPNRFLLGLDYTNPTFMTGHDLLLPLHLNHHFSLIKKDVPQTLISFENSNKGLRPFWGWSVEIRDDRLWFVLHKFQDSSQPKENREEFQVMHFPNRMLFFGRWNTLIISCRNDLHFKESNLTFCVNGQAKSLKLSVDRETLFHYMDKKSNPIDPQSFSFSPCIAVHFLLNKLVLCRGFRGKLARVLVFKGDMKSNDLETMDQKLGVLSDLDSIRAFKLMQEWMAERHYLGKLIFNLEAFAFRGQREKIFGGINGVLETIIFGSNDLEKIGNKKKKNETDDENFEPENSFNQEIEMLKRFCVKITDDSSFADIYFTPVFCNVQKEKKINKSRDLSSPFENLKDLQRNKRQTNLSSFQKSFEGKTKETFTFEFDMCSNDPYHFDYSLFQQEFFDPLLSCLPAIALHEKTKRAKLLEIWVKCITNFLSKPKLCSHFSQYYLRNKIIKKLLAAYVACGARHPDFPLFTPKVCDIYLENINSLDLQVSETMINDFLLDRCFLFEMVRTPLYLNYGLSKLAVWLYKYKNLRRVLDWQRLLDNIVFFLSISDFSASESRGKAHFDLSSQLATFFLLFFPFGAAQNESLLLFHRQLGLDTQFAIFGFLFGETPPPSNQRNQWPVERFEAVTELIRSFSNGGQNEKAGIKLDLKMILYSLGSPLLTKCSAKTGLLLDLLFLLIERHAILPGNSAAASSGITNPFGRSASENKGFDPKMHFGWVFRSLFFEFKNNSSWVLIRSLALLIKSGHSFDLVPASFFGLRKFINRSPVNSMYLSLYEFEKDSSIKLEDSSALVEYLFSVFFQNYSLSGFFDHERLSVSDAQALRVFFGMTRYLKTASLEKSLQIFSILLQHNTKEHFFPYFSSGDALCAFLDLMFRFSPLPQNELFLKLRLFEELKAFREKEESKKEKNIRDSKIENKLKIDQEKARKSSLSSMRKSEILKAEDLSDLLVYFSSLKIDAIEHLKQGISKPAVFDLSLRVLRLLQSTCLDSLRDILTFSYHICFFSTYFSSLESCFLQIKVLSTSLNQLMMFQNYFKLEEELVLTLLVSQNALTRIDFSFYRNSLFLSPELNLHFETISQFLKLYIKCTISRFEVESVDCWFRKMRFRFLGPDRRFPVDLGSLMRRSEFSLVHILITSGRLRARAKSSQKPKEAGTERSLETIFVLSHILVEVIVYFEKWFSEVSRLKLSKEDPSGEKMDVRLIEVLDVLAQHFQLVLLLSRHTFFKKKKIKWQSVFNDLIVRLFQLFLKIFEHVDFLQPEEKWKMLKQLVLDPFQILSSSKVVCVETLRNRTEAVRTSFLPIYVISQTSFKNLASLSSLCLRIPFHFLLDPESDTPNSESNNVKRKPKGEKGFFSMLAKGFRRENKVFKRVWKENSFLTGMARDLYLITTQKTLDFEKMEEIKGFAGVLEAKLKESYFESKNKGKKTPFKGNLSVGERYGIEKNMPELSILARSQAMQNEFGRDDISRRVIRMGESQKKSLFPGFIKEIENQLWGKTELKIKQSKKDEKNDKKWLKIDLDNPKSFEILEKPKKTKKKRKKDKMGRDKLSVMNQSFLLPYQEVLGTVSFEFEEQLVSLFRENYKMNKKLYGARGIFSLLETPSTDYLRFRIENSLKRDFDETLLPESEIDINKESSEEENIESKSDSENLRDSKKEFEFEKKRDTNCLSSKSENEQRSLKNNGVKADVSDSGSGGLSAVSADFAAQSDIESKLKEIPSRKVTKSLRSIRIGSQGGVKRESIFGRTKKNSKIESLGVSKVENPKATSKELKVNIKQNKMTTRNFQRPFIKAQIRFESSQDFALKPTLSKPGRRGLILIFKSHFNVLEKMNSYLKAFFEMEKFSLREPTPKKKNRRRRNKVVKEPLPFSAVLHYARFRGMIHMEAFVVLPFSSLPCVVFFKGEELCISITDIARERRHHLELKRTIFKPDKGLIRKYAIMKIFRVFEYKFLHCDKAVHILFRDNKSLILHFHTKELRTEFLNVLSDRVPGAVEKSLDHKNELRRQNLRNQWAFYSNLSNFSLVSLLNLIGSRSLDDFSQYPVFPLVISKAENPELEWRDLSKPVGMIGDPNKIDLLSQKYKKADNFDEIPPYFYGSHYSSPATTFHFLLRMKPFDSGAKSIQNGRFDLPDRLFHSWDNVLDNIQKETSDVRECPPELYYQPLILINLNDLDFGVNQSGERVDHVITPELLGVCPFRFVYRLRKALESERVSLSLNEWVNLIFGSKQLGEKAEKAHNVFFYLTYQHSKANIDSARKRDQEALETQVFHFGQTPFQLTETSWPQRRCLDLSVVSTRFTKKYFVKKVFYENFEVQVSTCEFCLQKIEKNNSVVLNEKNIMPLVFCEKCRLCSDCSNSHLRFLNHWDINVEKENRKESKGNMAGSMRGIEMEGDVSNSDDFIEVRSRPRSKAISKGKASVQSDDSNLDPDQKNSKFENIKEAKKTISDWQEKYRKESDRSLHNEIVKKKIDQEILNVELRKTWEKQKYESQKDNNDKNKNAEKNDNKMNENYLKELFETNNYKSVRLGSISGINFESKNELRHSKVLSRSEGRYRLKKEKNTSNIKNPFENSNHDSKIESNRNSSPKIKNLENSNKKIILEPSIDIFSKNNHKKPKKNLFEKHCEFCVQREILEKKVWSDNGAPHENAVLMIKEISFMDLERKFISKIAILRPFKIDYYTFVLFKADKSVFKKGNIGETSEEAENKFQKNPEMTEKKKLQQKLNQRIPGQSKKKPDPRIRMTGVNDKGGLNEKGNPTSRLNPPFELNLNKCLSLEKLRIEMRKWGILGMNHSLWTRKGCHELDNYTMFLGGCCLGTLRIYSVKKNKLLYEYRLHRFMIEKISISVKKKVLTKDQTGVIIISQYRPKVHNSESFLRPLYSVHGNYQSCLSHIKFGKSDDQIFMAVWKKPGEPERLRLFDSEKEGRVLTDLTLELTRVGDHQNRRYGTGSQNKLAESKLINQDNQSKHQISNSKKNKKPVQEGRGSLIYNNRRNSVPELKINSRQFRRSLLKIDSQNIFPNEFQSLDVATTKIGRETTLAFSALGSVLEYIDLSFGYLNCIVMVVRDDLRGEYVISTKTLEGVELTTFCIKIKSKEHLLSSFLLFKDSLFQDNLVCMNQKGDIYFFDLPYIENVKMISSKVKLRPKKIQVIAQSKAIVISDSEGLLHFYTVLPNQPKK